MNRAKNYLLIFVLILLIISLACVRTTPRPDLVFTPDSLPDAQAGVPYEVEIQISQNETPAIDFYLSDGNLPKGLTLDYVPHEDKVKISGVPEEAGTFIFKTSVYCYGTSISGQTGEKEYTIVVK